MNIASILARKGGKVVTCRPEQSIRQALALLAEHNIGALVAVDAGGVPTGIVSERDIVREAARDERLFARTVGEIMTRNVIVGVPEDDLRAVRHTMTERHIRHLPVVAKPDPKWGETPCAFVTLRPEAAPVTAGDVIAWCREHLAHFKAPHAVVFGPLPKTSTGKIQKYVLREQAKAVD